MFAAACSFPWPAVIQAAGVAKGFFPQLDGPDVPGLSSLLRDALSECFVNLTPIHRHEFTRFLVGAFIARRRLFQAAHAPCPLAQGTDLHEHQDECMSMLRQKEVKGQS
ncbi:hypothetical protein VZT92_017901 [Zoarces viviparus]|uniref:Uncharacterized protein n=1 Tax=Zoarces viviparus TaxID=48416 RepID=A0AAW1ERZ5_ZOAVI